MNVIIYEKYEEIKYIMFKDVKETLIKACNEILKLNKAEDEQWKKVDSLQEQLEQLNMKKYKKGKIIKALIYKKEIAKLDMEMKSLISQKQKIIEKANEIYEQSGIIGVNFLGRRYTSSNKLIEKLTNISNAKTLEELNISFEEACRILGEANIEIVLDESDKRSR
ncbi:MAG: hypothetical protein IJV31_12535 [Clostridia bacterium]|nr:hypothetical protein [Clostridia bacterium]